MKQFNDFPSWCRGIINKRSPLVLKILLDLVEAGIRTGHCSPNDIKQHCSRAECKAIGACFKILKRIGFVQLDKRIKPTTQQSNGRLVHIWELRERGRAEIFINETKKRLLGIGEFEEQPSLFGSIASTYQVEK